MAKRRRGCGFVLALSYHISQFFAITLVSVVVNKIIYLVAIGTEVTLMTFINEFVCIVKFLHQLDLYVILGLLTLVLYLTDRCPCDSFIIK